jgi:hypothetical protein
MKRFIAAVSFAALATPVLADSKPYEQLDVDRALPNVAERTVSETRYPFNGSAPFEQIELNRALPELRSDRTQVAEGGNTRSDVEISAEASAGDTGVSPRAEGPWANDHNFIAPAQ